MRKINKIEPTLPVLPTRKKVAAYARVSVETERLHHSLSAQVSYYSELIQANPEWEYVGVYADDGITGTKTSKREEFQRMLDDCEAGKIDIILTKSISRFARNTVDLLETVRHLKELGIEVRFEKENINSLSGDGEVMMTLLASFAQEEITSLSNNVKWGVRKRMEQGILKNGRISSVFRWKNIKNQCKSIYLKATQYLTYKKRKRQLINPQKKQKNHQQKKVRKNPMNNKPSSHPLICIDFKKNRIRIHRNTLRQIGNPEYIQLLVNPAQKMIGIKASCAEDKLAHKVKDYFVINGNSYELYSRELLYSLSQLNLSWEKFNIFRLEGNIYPDKKIALFSMDNIITKLPQAEFKSEIMGDEYAQL